MPIYEYACKECGKTFELLVASSSKNRAARAICPHCGSPKAGRQLSTFAAHSDANSAPCRLGKCPGSSGSAAGGSCASGFCPFK